MSTSEPRQADHEEQDMKGDGAKSAFALDLPLIAGLVIALGAAVLGIAATGVGIGYFFQPVACAIVLGGTLGVFFVTTPRAAMFHSVRRVKELFFAPLVDRTALIEEIVHIARVTRLRGMLGMESAAHTVSTPFLRDGLLLAVDVKKRKELLLALETELRMRERHGEADAKVLEVAGGFAPTIGILGTVVGLIQVLRQFSNLEAVAAGIGSAFVSTIYGLVLANLILLPLAHRIRARVAEAFEIDELILEGVMCVFDQVHPSLIRSRLLSFLHPAHDPRRQVFAEAVPGTSALQE
jgi:chemotaxis protein MotA